jgi:uncharacterized protein YbaR (Trm112 family)
VGAGSAVEDICAEAEGAVRRNAVSIKPIVTRIFMTIMTAAVPGRNAPARLRSSSMPVDPELLEILACPNCKTKVDLVKDGTALKCGQCKRVYPIKDDIPVMLLDEATVEP